MNIKIESKGKITEESIDLKALIVVGFAGKDIEKTMEHIKELEAEGIKCPREVPVPYQCSKDLLTTKDTIEVISNDTSGEVEYLVLVYKGHYYIGIGSDHTDRKLEATSIHKSKQVCSKPYATTFWDYDDIKDHFDQIKLQSTQVLNGKTIDYQSGFTSDLLPLQTIVDKVNAEVVADPILIYTGTVPLNDGFKYGEKFSCALVDPVLNRQLSLSYSISVINEH